MKTLYKNLKNLSFALVLFGGLLVSCADLDVPSPTVVSDDDVFANDETIILYLSRMYSQMPFEDFKWSPDRNYFDDWLVIPDCNSGQCINRDSGRTFTDEGNQRGGAYWGRGFNLLRDANYLLEVIPKYKSNFSEAMYNHCIGEAYFARAMVFYAFARRYGGSPLVLEVLKYPDNTAEELEIPRSTEAETWDQVLDDFNKAIELVSATSPRRGLCNKDVAQSFKAAAMLYAGSVAKYNQQTGFGQKTGVRVIGFDPGTEQAYARKYFKEAYLAARTIMNTNRYSLYGANATDPEVQYKNMVDMFFDAGSPENIYIKEYSLSNMAHGYDVYAVPIQLQGGGYSSNACPTLDFVEMYELPDLDRYPDGTIKNFDSPNKNDPNRKYLLFDDPMDLFRHAEPRLRAYVCFPMDVMKGVVVEVRSGVYSGEVDGGIPPILKVNGQEIYDQWPPAQYNQVDAYLGTGDFAKTPPTVQGTDGNTWPNPDKNWPNPNDPNPDNPRYRRDQVLFLSQAFNNQSNVIIRPPGKPQQTINASGLSGPFHTDGYSLSTGFGIRKWIVDSRPTSSTTEGWCTQHFVLMRYAEILLTVAEAGCELSLLGEPSPDGANMLQLAEDALKAIRARAGATVNAGLPLVFNEDGRDLIRRERQKELAYEHKNTWDIRRWRTHHKEVFNGSSYENGTRYRGIYPYYAEKADKYFFDIRLDLRNIVYTFREINYYLAIPGGEVSKSPVIDQQPFR